MKEEHVFTDLDGDQLKVYRPVESDLRIQIEISEDDIFFDAAVLFSSDEIRKIANTMLKLANEVEGVNNAK